MTPFFSPTKSLLKQLPYLRTAEDLDINTHSKLMSVLLVLYHIALHLLTFTHSKYPFLFKQKL